MFLLVSGLFLVVRNFLFGGFNAAYVQQPVSKHLYINEMQQGRESQVAISSMLALKVLEEVQ